MIDKDAFIMKYLAECPVCKEEVIGYYYGKYDDNLKIQSDSESSRARPPKRPEIMILICSECGNVFGKMRENLKKV